MAVIDTTRPTVAGIGIGTRLSGVMTALLAAYSTWADKRSTRLELNRLTDRELDDIGLSRGDIDRITR
jgi:uncharacterized protein YjiS (DUF1127 family)